MKSFFALSCLFISFASLACNGPEICVGDRVIYTSGDRAQVQEVFSNGKIAIKWDNSAWSESVVRKTELSKSVNCLSQICTGDRVAFTSGDRATVREMFANRKVIIDWDNSAWSDSAVSLNELAKSSECSGRICVGNRVAYTSGDTGRIVETYDDGRVVLDWDNSAWSNSVVKEGQVSRAYRCMGELCRGDRVIYTSNDRASVVEIYEDGRVKIDWDNSAWSNSVVRIDELGFSVGECRD
jgi:preprotein translocase subunit YajC